MHFLKKILLTTIYLLMRVMEFLDKWINRLNKSLKVLLVMCIGRDTK